MSVPKHLAQHQAAQVARQRAVAINDQPQQTNRGFADSLLSVPPLDEWIEPVLGSQSLRCVAVREGWVASRCRMHLAYLWRHRRLLSLARPRRFTELVQRRKLIDRDPRIPLLIDKLAVKAFVAHRLGADWVTPTLWSGTLLPATPPVRPPCVVKARHGCNQTRIVRDGAADWQEIRRAAASWIQKSYGGWLDEWGYRHVPRGVLVEPFIGVGPRVPVDYKLYVFHGRVEAIQVHLDRETAHQWSLFDRHWQLLSTPGRRSGITPPATLDLMIAGAEILARGFDFVRIDFYDHGETPRFGEMTFYPGSGLDPFAPAALDLALGELWLRDSPPRQPD